LIANKTPRPKKLRRQGQARPGQPLNRREITILYWSSQGETRNMIAKRLGISVSYVKRFCERIFRKLGTHTMAHAVFKGCKQVYLDLSDPPADRRRKRTWKVLSTHG